MPAVDDAIDLVSRWQPQAVILQAGRPDALALLVRLGDRAIPCVLLGTSAQLPDAARQHPACVELLLPATLEEIAEAVRLVVGPAPAGRLADLIDLGVLKIDLRTRVVQVDGDRKVLPPREFEILVQLALQPGVPLAATELLARIWPESRSATLKQLHTRVWRLRKLLGDPRRPAAPDRQPPRLWLPARYPRLAQRLMTSSPLRHPERGWRDAEGLVVVFRAMLNPSA